MYKLCISYVMLINVMICYVSVVFKVQKPSCMDRAPGGIFGSASNNLEEHEWRNSLGNSSRCYGSKTVPGLIK